MTGGTLVGAGGVLGAAIGAVVGSIVSQGVAMAVGIQDRFSWKSVALSAVSAGVASSVGAAASAAGGWISGATLAPTVARAAIANAVTQGIGVATGLQERFSWAAVAAAGAGGAVGQYVGDALQQAGTFNDLGQFGASLARGTVRGFAAGLTTAVLRGGRVSVVQVATDAFGQALGNSIAEYDWGGTARQAVSYSPDEQAQDFAGEERRFASTSATNAEAAKDSSMGLGIGLQITQAQIAAWGPRFFSENDYAFQRPDYGLLPEGQTIRLASMMGETSPQQTMRDWDPNNEWDTARGPLPTDVPIAGLRDDFLKGCRDPRGVNRSVMDAPATAGETVGRYTGAAVDSLKNFAGTITGLNSMNAAQASWRAGNYGTALLHGAQALGEAGTTVFGFGLGSTGRYSATMTAGELAAVRGTYADSALNLSPYEIRFSQNSVSFKKVDRFTGQSYTYDDLVASMRSNGWKGDPVDVVRMPDGKLTSMDNTRITAAREVGIDVRATVRSFEEPLAPEMQNARGWGKYSTWGDAISTRINNQSKSFSTANPSGSWQPPRIKGQP